MIQAMCYDYFRNILAMLALVLLLNIARPLVKNTASGPIIYGENKVAIDKDYITQNRQMFNGYSENPQEPESFLVLAILYFQYERTGQSFTAETQTAPCGQSRSHT